MRKGDKSGKVAEMAADHDFSGGVRGKYAARFAEGSNIVILDPDVQAAFPDSEAVNRALRVLLDAARATVPSGEE